jgi:prepilin signal peptidase PulO-like enzyme (type II secretory pathway)
LLLFSRAKFTGTKNQVPFGPFLGLGWILSVFFHTEILEYAQSLTDSFSFIIGYL